MNKETKETLINLLIGTLVLIIIIILTALILNKIGDTVKLYPSVANVTVGLS